MTYYIHMQIIGLSITMEGRGGPERRSPGFALFSTVQSHIQSIGLPIAMGGQGGDPNTGPPLALPLVFNCPYSENIIYQQIRY